MKRKPPRPLRYVTTTLELGEPPSEFSVPIAPWFEPDEFAAIERAAKSFGETPTQYVHRMACAQFELSKSLSAPMKKRKASKRKGKR